MSTLALRGIAARRSEFPMEGWWKAGNRGRGWRDKSACHAPIQAAVVACLLACRAVGRWQVLRFCQGNSMLPPAQWRFGAAPGPERAAP